MPPKERISDHDLLIRIDERMENVEAFILKAIEENKERDKKITSLESFRTYVKGSWAVIAIITTAIWQWFSK
jgi:hypothetical protein